MVFQIGNKFYGWKMDVNKMVAHFADEATQNSTNHFVRTIETLVLAIAEYCFHTHDITLSLILFELPC